MKTFAGRVRAQIWLAGVQVALACLLFAVSLLLVFLQTGFWQVVDMACAATNFLLVVFNVYLLRRLWKL